MKFFYRTNNLSGILVSPGFWRFVQSSINRRMVWWLVIALAVLTAIGIRGIMTFNFFIISGYYQLIPFLIVVLIAYIVHKLTVYQKYFWQGFAKKMGWSYKERDNLTEEKGLMFRQGHARSTTNIITGILDSRPLRLRTYSFQVGSGKASSTYAYTVYTLRFKGRFPHLYLDHRRDGFGLQVGVRLPVPREFEDSFFLYAPEEYEIEALAVFTPDVFAGMLDHKLYYDLEFIDQELHIYIDQLAYEDAMVEKHLAIVCQTAQLFARALDVTRFQEIPQHAPTLHSKI